MKVVFDFVAQQISIEGDGPHLIEALQAARALAPAFSQINISTITARASAPQESAKPRQNQGGAAGTNGTGYSGKTIKQFTKSLRLNNASERIAALAYYVKHHEGKDVFSPKEMEGWFNISALPKPSQMPVALFDARRHHGYLESAGRAKWILTTNGENLIVGKLNQSEEGAEV